MNEKKGAPDAKLTKHRRFHLNYPWLSAAVPLVVLVVGLSIAHPRFLTQSNVTSILLQAAVYVIMALGMSFVLMTGGIDLSQGSLLALVGVVAADLLQRTNSIPLAIIASILVGAAVGAANGLVVSEDPAIHHDAEHHVSMPGLDACHHAGHADYRSEYIVQMDRRRQCPGHPGPCDNLFDCCGCWTVHFVLHGHRPVHFGGRFKSGGGTALRR